jgi:hypothetical protein
MNFFALLYATNLKYQRTLTKSFHSHSGKFNLWGFRQ